VCATLHLRRAFPRTRRQQATPHARQRRRP
jgi:hypothetical protein